jgi:hypothetical protein
MGRKAFSSRLCVTVLRDAPSDTSRGKKGESFLPRLQRKN